MIIAAYAMGATVGYNYIHGEIFEVYERFEGGRSKKPRAAGYLGDRILGSNHSFQLSPTTASAPTSAARRPALLSESIEGKKGQPRFKPPFPANFGLYGKPTTINNTETFACGALDHQQRRPVPECGKPNNGGTKIFSMVGVNAPGNYEVPMARRSPSCSSWPGGSRRRGSRR